MYEGYQDWPAGYAAAEHAGYEGFLLELVPSRVSWGRHHRVVGGRQAIIGNWRGWDAAYRKLEGEMKPP